ncbi:HNH endonuclease [Corallincola luteus]|nr:HNH endonuclease [Corallincola luteus]
MFTKTPAGERARVNQTLLIDSLSASYLFLARHQLDGRNEMDAIWHVRDDYYARLLLQSHSESWGVPFNLRALYCQLKDTPPLLHLKSDETLLQELTGLIANGDVLVFQEANYLVDKQDPSSFQLQPMAGSSQKAVKRAKASSPSSNNPGPGVTQPTSQGGKAAPLVASDVPWENQIWSDTSVAEKLLVSVGWGFSEVSELLQDVAAWESDTSETFDQIGADPSTPEPIRFAAAALKLPARIGTGLVSGVAGLGDLIINPDTRNSLKDGVVKLYQDPELRAQIAQDFVNQPPHEIASDVLVIAADIAMGGKGAAKLGTKVNKTTPDVPVTKSTTTVSKQSSKLAKQSDEYAALINSNKPWSWESFTDGASLTIKEKRAIKADAIARGLIPDIPYKVGTKYPDFEAAGLIEKLDELPPELWKQSDYKQFKWLDSRIPGGKPEGFTWHHSEIPGRMELVPFGPHNSINHSGGRSKGNWADAKR